MLSKLSSPGKGQLLGAGIEPRRWLERFVDPGDQVAIDEQLLAQQSGEIRQTRAKAGAQLQVRRRRFFGLREEALREAWLG